ncbi:MULTISPECIES: hypothetical protein [Actinotignum]|uniref:Uncharacterized protein n=1 Tax=Actinotignum timonense TaxID=1870995 RepID=A0AAW9HDM8_9ACTO|nr:MULTISPECIES: hypothetical protein [Actinotignum]MDE1559257.1 hypothetical protein [Actinotignum schaalii]MDE1664236.1 hypothetical protein [Actinotignum schaalii]MDK6373689.1 hypothetical protein [Actinotignum timonense]MDK6419371.1 hypothetical protein [Actinotignum timonense]MDK6646083.1 hypothetical protein [Actinotignum timonense]
MAIDPILDKAIERLANLASNLSTDDQNEVAAKVKEITDEYLRAKEEEEAKSSDSDS